MIRLFFSLHGAALELLGFLVWFSGRLMRSAGCLQLFLIIIFLNLAVLSMHRLNLAVVTSLSGRSLFPRRPQNNRWVTFFLAAAGERRCYNLLLLIFIIFYYLNENVTVKVARPRVFFSAFYTCSFKGTVHRKYKPVWVCLSVWVLRWIQRIWSSVDNLRQQQKCRKKAQRSNCVSSQTVSALKGSVCVLVPLIFPDNVLFLWLRTVGNARSLDCSSAFSDLDRFRLKWLQFVIRHLSIKCFIATATQVFKTFLKYYNPDLVL